MLADADLGGEFHSKQKYGPKIGRQSWEMLQAAAAERAKQPVKLDVTL